MQVTIDTRHDTLEEALAVIRLAFARASEPASARPAGPRRTGTKKTAAKSSRSPKSAYSDRRTRGEKGTGWQEGSHLPR